MRSVDVADLKNRLSTYLTYAKAGEVIVISDRNLPVTSRTALCLAAAQAGFTVISPDPAMP